MHLDLVGDQEAGEQADAELAEELVPGEAEVVALGAAADRGQQLVHLRLGQPDAAVVHPQRAVAGAIAELERDRRGRLGIDGRRAVIASTAFCSSSRT